MAFTGPEADRLAIRELYEGYADGATRQDREAWLAAYADDARWTTPYFDVSGVEAIGAMFDAIMADVVDVTFTLQIGALEIEGDQARCRMVQAESLLYPDGQTWDLTGSYEDTLVRKAGRWWFEERRYTIKRESRPVPPDALFTGPLADRVTIAELMQTYADAASRADKAQWLACWAADAVWVTRQGTVAGHAALAASWDTLHETMDALAFFAMPAMIRVTGDTATARCHVREIARFGDRLMKFSARYDDTLVREAGRWTFARREYAMNIAE